MEGNSSDNLEDMSHKWVKSIDKKVLKSEISNNLEITIKHSPAKLGGRGQRQTSVVKLVAIVTHADLKLYGIVNIL